MLIPWYEPSPCRAQPPALPETLPRLPRPTRDDLGVKLKPAQLEATDRPLPINLATALRLSDARPLIVAAAQASAWVAEAQLTRAKVLWVPRLNLGADYIRHDGGGPDFNKGILTAPSVNFFYAGAGMMAERQLVRCHLSAPGRAAGPEFPAMGHPGREE